MSIYDAIEQDVWRWIREFVAVPNKFYDFKFPPCPYARGALVAETVDVAIFRSGDFRTFIRVKAIEMRDNPKLTTRVMAFPPRAQLSWGLGEFVEELNSELIPDNVFLNIGLAKNSNSLYSGTSGKPYFIVVANRLEAVLRGSEALQRTKYYENWPRDHYEIVVKRRARMAARYGKPKQ